jgi:acyl-CoA thioesterase
MPITKMKAMLSAEQIVLDRMYSNDPFSRWLGIEVVHVSAGHSILKMTIREEMLNGFGLAHGGIAYALADSALAFAANAHGQQSLSVHTDIRHTRPIHAGEELLATARELSLSRSFGHYEVTVAVQEKVVALFTGMVYRTGKNWE